MVARPTDLVSPLRDVAEAHQCVATGRNSAQAVNVTHMHASGTERAAALAWGGAAEHAPIALAVRYVAGHC